MKKAVSVGTSAALLASLFTAVVAGPVAASVTVTGAGNVPTGGTSSGTVTIVLQEQDIASLPTDAAGSIDLVMTDSAGASTVEWDGTPVVSGPGSLGTLSAVVGTTGGAANGTLTVSWTRTDIHNVESITISGLAIDADAGAALGAIKLNLANPTGNASIGAFQAGGNASGFLATGVSIGATAATVNVTTTGCTFTDTGVAGSGKYAFAAGAAGTTAESLSGTAGALNTPLTGQQVLTITTAGGFASAHNAGDVVTQTTACAASGVLASPGTVVAALAFAKPTNAVVFPGENNSPANNLVLTEPSAGFLPKSSTFTYTILTDGVVFSRPPVVAENDAGMTLSAPVLAADRKSATVTVTAASTGAGTVITLSGILYDVASTVPGGTFIKVGVTTSGSLAVNPTSRSNAVVFRGINATASATPIVYIGENSQATGIVSFTESAAGFFTAGGGPNNTFEICPNGVGFHFTFAPYAKVTGGTAAGNVILRDGNVASTTNIVKGVQDGDCYFWTVWTASTTASTIQIGNTDVSSGPLINVDTRQPAGPVLVDLYIGSSALDDQLAATVQFATAMFRNQVAVTALSQPVIPQGSTDALAGNIQVAETGLGQLKNGEEICVEVLPRVSNFTFQDTYLKALTTADLPVATASGGLVIGPVVPSTEGCRGIQGNQAGTHMISFSFFVQQQSTSGQGKVVISNIHYITTADAPNGNVLVNVFGLGGNPTNVEFQSTVSNARIGVAGVADAWVAKGLNVRAASAFALTTASVKRGTYVTVRGKSSGAAAGSLVEIWVKTKTTAWHKESSRRVSTDGYVYYSGKVLNLGYRYYRFLFTNGGGTSNTVRAFGK